MKTAAAYIRVSTEDQTEFSPDSQLDRIREYARRNDYILPPEFIFMDDGISGRKAEKRPQFMRMIGIAKKKPKPFDTILLWKFSRFARNREDSIVYKSMLRKQCGIDVISVSENLGDDKMSILIEALIEAMDEFYSINLSEEVKRGMTEKAKRGGVLSVPAYGYRVDGGQYVPVPEEAEVIKTVFRRYCEGAGMLRIAKELNAIGIHTHRGGRIENRTIEYWLNNPIYIGKTRWTPSGKAGRRYHNPDSIVADGQHTAIIDEETWEKTQKLMKEQKERCRAYYKPSDKPSHWLVSICRCGLCGGPLVNCTGYMYCGNRSKGICTGNGSIKVMRIEDIVLNQLREITASNKYISIPIQGKNLKADETRKLLEQQLKKAYARLNRVKEAYEIEIDTIDEYKLNKQKIMAEITAIKSQIVNADEKKQEDDFLQLRDTIKSSIDILSDPNIKTTEKREIAGCFIEEIVKTGENGREICIFYRT